MSCCWHTQKIGKTVSENSRKRHVSFLDTSQLFNSQVGPGAHASAAVSHRYDDGGMLKITYSTAFTVSLLSWALSQFKGGYKASGNLDLAANTVR